MNFNECWYTNVCTKDVCDQNTCIRYLEMKSLMELSLIPSNKQTKLVLYPDDIDFEAFNSLADLKDDIKGFTICGHNLYLHSKNTGNGKTTWAIKLMLKFFDEVWAGNGFRTRGLFIHVPTLLAKLKDFNNFDIQTERLKKELPHVDLVIWDDLASAGLSNYDMAQLLTIIDQRLLNGKSNIYTSNLDKNGLEKVLGQRLASRIWNSTYNIELKGGDSR